VIHNALGRRNLMLQKKMIIISIFTVFLSVFAQPLLSAENDGAKANVNHSRFTQKIDYMGTTTKPSGITITDQQSQIEYKLPKAEIMKMIQNCGEIRKAKQVRSNHASPLVPTKSIKFTSTIDKMKTTEEHPLYEIKDKESKRKARDLIQKLYDESKQGNKPAPLFLQIGPDENTDITIIRPGLDIAASPLRKSEKAKEGYLASKPPAYGTAVNTSPLSFQKTLKLVEGARSNSAPVLRHIAQTDDDFIGKDKGGAQKLRNYDIGKVTKTDEEKVFKLFASLFISKLKEKKASSNIVEIKEKIICELATETDSASFIIINESSDRTENYGYNEYIRPCFEGLFKETLIRIYDNDPILTELTIDPSSNAWDGSMNVTAVSWALTHNTNLTKLNCTTNNTNDDGAKALAEMLKVNKTILELNLYNNHIEWGVIYLAEAIEHNTSLIYIDLSLNSKMYRVGNGGKAVRSILGYINRNRISKGMPQLDAIDTRY